MSNYLRREGDSFIFRRRIPCHLQDRLRRKEIYRSLNTTVRKTAKAHAAMLFLQTERLFTMAEEDQDYIPSDEDIRAAVRLHLSSERWQKRLLSLERQTPGQLRAHQDELARSLLITVAPDDGFTERDIMYAEARDALEDSDFTGDGKVMARTVDILLHTLQGYVDRRVQEVFQPETLAAAKPAEGGTVPMSTAGTSTSKLVRHQRLLLPQQPRHSF